MPAAKSKSNKQVFGFKADPDFIALIDKIVGLSQLGVTETKYKDRSGLFLQATAKEVARFLNEAKQNPAVANIAGVILEAHDGERLIKDSYDGENNAEDPDDRD